MKKIILVIFLLLSINGYAIDMADKFWYLDEIGIIPVVYNVNTIEPNVKITIKANKSLVAMYIQRPYTDSEVYFNRCIVFNKSDLKKIRKLLNKYMKFIKSSHVSNVKKMGHLYPKIYVLSGLGASSQIINPSTPLYFSFISGRNSLNFIGIVIPKPLITTDYLMDKDEDFILLPHKSVMLLRKYLSKKYLSKKTK